MGVELLTERYRDRIAGVLSRYDRIIMQGTPPKWCYASGMTSYFYERQIKVFDYPAWAQPLRDGIRANTERLAAEHAADHLAAEPHALDTPGPAKEAARVSDKGIGHREYHYRRRFLVGEASGA